MKKRSNVAKKRNRPNILAQLLFALALVTSIGVALFLNNYKNSTDNRSRAVDNNGLGNKFVEVGPEEVVMDVNQAVKNSPIIGIDSPPITMKTPNGVQGYIASGVVKRDASGNIVDSGPAGTYRFTAPTLDQLFKPNTGEYFKPSLDPAQTPTKLDADGAWLMSIYPLDSTTVLGWYHGEAFTNDAFKTTHRQFSAISRDGGKTWRSLGLVATADPNPQVRSDSPNAFQEGKDDLSTGTVIRRGDTFYMMFTHYLGGGIVSGIGKSNVGQVINAMKANLPGDSLWKKYYCDGAGCGFKTSSLGGKTSNVNSTYSTAFSYNTAVNQFMTVLPTARWGINMSFTNNNNATSWNQPTVIVPGVSKSKDGRADDWQFSKDPLSSVDAANYQRLARLSYGSIIATDGSMGNVGREFYIYYVKNPEFKTFWTMWLVRRKVSIKDKAINSPLTAINPLVEYRMKGKNKTRTSIDNPTRMDYATTGRTIGWVSANPGAGLVPLFECYYDGWDNYMLVTSGAIDDSDPSQYKCKNNLEKFVRLVGYISQTKTNTATLPLIDCFDEKNLNHYYVTSETGCGANRKGNTWGYIMQTGALTTAAAAPKPVVPAPKPVSPAPKPVAPAPKPVAPAPVPQPDLTLSQVSKRAKDGKYKTRVVTSKSQPDTTLGTARVLGKIYSTPGTGRVALHECYFASWDEYIMMTSASTTRPSSFCPNTTAGWTETYKGVVGYVGAAKSTIMTKPFKECYDETNFNHHYAVTDPACSVYAAALSPRPTTRESWVYGWVQ